jgi:hypothetical protein
MVNGNGEYCKNVDEIISEKSEKIIKKIIFSDFFWEGVCKNTHCINGVCNFLKFRRHQSKYGVEL